MRQKIMCYTSLRHDFAQNDIDLFAVILNVDANASQSKDLLRKYRIIRVVGWRVYFPSGAPANFAGLLAASQGICRMCMAEMAPPDMPPVCAVFP